MKIRFTLSRPEWTSIGYVLFFWLCRVNGSKSAKVALPVSQATNR